MLEEIHVMCNVTCLVGEVLVVGAGDNNSSHVELWTLSTQKMPVHRQYTVTITFFLQIKLKHSVINFNLIGFILKCDIIKRYCTACIIS